MIKGVGYTVKLKSHPDIKTRYGHKQTRNHKAIPLKNINTKILNKIIFQISKWIQEHIKKMVHCD